ncbi:MAG: GNAT family N-acetyltransferase [Cyanobacteria bacterium J06626_6]
MKAEFPVVTMAELDVVMRYMREFHDFDHSEPFDEACARQTMQTILSDPAVGRIWLICQTGEAVGYMAITLSYRLEYRGAYAFLDELYIRADHRGKGLGTAALAFLQTACQSLGLKALQLEVKANNPGATALYRKVGFQMQSRCVFLQSLS